MPVEGRTTYVSPSRWGGTGYILTLRGGLLLAQSFDAKRNELLGEPLIVAESYAHSSSVNAIVTLPPDVPPVEQLVSRNRSGKQLGLIGEPGHFGPMSFSADGARLAQPVLDPATNETDIWIRDLKSNTISRLTSSGPDFQPVWSPDGAQMIFGLGGSRSRTPLYRRAPLAAEPVSLGIDGRPTDWSRDGRFLLYAAYNGGLHVIELGKGSKGVPFIDAAYQGRFSPESDRPPRWIAYSRFSGFSGQSEVFVQGFTPGKPASEEIWKVSVSGGDQPRWRADGKELFYRAGNKMMAVPIDSTATSFRAGAPVVLFESQPGIDYVVTSDGSRFLLSEIVPNQPPARPGSRTVTLNWQSLLHK